MSNQPGLACVMMVIALQKESSKLEPPPLLDRMTERQSELNVLIPYRGYDEESIVRECVELLTNAMQGEHTENVHDTVNFNLQRLLKFKFIIETNLLKWIGKAVFYAIFESSVHLSFKAKYADTFVQLARKLKRAGVILELDAAVIANFIQSRFLNIQTRAMFKFEEDSFSAICKAVKKSRPHLTESSVDKVKENLINPQSLEDIQQALMIRSLLFPEALEDSDFNLWKYTRRHNIQCLAEMMRMKSKKYPQSVSISQLIDIVDRCCEYIGLKTIDKSIQSKQNPCRGKLGQHLKLASTAAFVEFPVLIGDLFGNLLYRGNDESDSYILQFIRQFELVVYPGSGNRTLSDNVLKLLQRLFAKLAKRKDRADLESESSNTICEIGVKYITRVVFEKNILNVMLCQNIARAIVHIDEEIIIRPIIEIVAQCLSLESEPLRLPPALALLAAVGSKLHLSHGPELLELLPKIIDCIDPNDSLKSIGAANVIESITMTMEPDNIRWLGGVETDVAMYLWDNIESVLERQINNSHDELHPSDSNVLEFVLSASGRFLGLLGSDVHIMLIQRLSDFICEENGFVIWKPFKQFILHYGRTGTLKNFDHVYRRTLSVTMERLANCKLDRVFEDRSCDQEIWLIHAVAFLSRFSSDHSISDVMAIGQMISKTANVRIAQSYGKLLKAIIKQSGTVYISSFNSCSRLCLLSDVNPKWYIPDSAAIEVCNSIAKQASLIKIDNLHCHALFSSYLLSGIMHFEATLSLLNVNHSLDEYIIRLMESSIQTITSRVINSEAREILLKVLLVFHSL